MSAENNKRQLDTSLEISPTTDQRKKMPNLTRSPAGRNNESMEDDYKPQKSQQGAAITQEWMVQYMESNINSRLDQFDMRLGNFEQRVEATLSQELDSLKIRFKEVEETNESLRQENKELNQRLLLVERETRQLNFVASGIEFATPQEGYHKLRAVINAATNNQVQVTGIRTFNTKDGKRIVAKCNNLDEKHKILLAKRNLSTTTTNGSRAPVYINDDLTKPDREAQSRLNVIAKEMRKTGRDVRMGFRKLKVDGEWLFFNETTNTLEKRTFRGNEEPAHPALERPRAAKEKGGDRQLHQ